MKRFLHGVVVAMVSVGAVAPAFADEQMWVATDRLNRRTCPSTECGVVGQLFFRESAVVIEQRDGWARISKFYDASCSGGRSAYVDKGNAACSPENGIVDGQFAEWVSMEHLVADRPQDPGAGSSGTAKLVSGSDDFRLHQAAFVKAAESLLASGQCVTQDFVEMGGFWKSTTNHASQPVYYTYCKGGQDRIYLNVQSGAIFR